MAVNLNSQREARISLPVVEQLYIHHCNLIGFSSDRRSVTCITQKHKLGLDVNNHRRSAISN